LSFDLSFDPVDVAASCSQIFSWPRRFSGLKIKKFSDLHRIFIRSATNHSDHFNGFGGIAFWLEGAITVYLFLIINAPAEWGAFR